MNRLRWIGLTVCFAILASICLYFGYDLRPNVSIELLVKYPKIYDDLSEWYRAAAIATWAGIAFFALSFCSLFGAFFHKPRVRISRITGFPPTSA